MSDETRQKLSQMRKGRIHSDETRHKIGMKHKGRIHTEESRHNMSEGQKNRPLISDETRKKLSEAGKNHSPESNRKGGDARRGDKNGNFGKVMSEEQRLKISNTLKTKHAEDEEFRRKQSEAHTNPSTETRKRMSDAAKRRREREKNNHLE